MRIGVITFPGSLDDVDARRAVRVAGGEPVALWHGDHDLQGVDAIVLPGGFSYGDYLRAGAIAAKAPIMAEVIDAAGKGMPVLGICNGFQMLAEARLVPGAHTRNAHQQFIRRDQKLRVENAGTAWTSGFDAQQEITRVLSGEDRNLTGWNIAFQVIRGAAAAWQSPALPLQARSAWHARSESDPAFGHWECTPVDPG